VECCTNTYNLRCFNHCNEIIFQDAPATEVLTLVFFGANHIIKKAFNAIINEPIIINLDGLMKTILTIYKFLTTQIR